MIQAGSLGEKGEIFLLDMGDPVKIVDLARNLIELSGLVPDKDVTIEFTGLRPGEKLDEELLIAGEHGIRSTAHSKVFVVEALNKDWSQVTVAVRSLESAARAGDAGAIHRILESLGMGYKGSEPSREVLPHRPAAAGRTAIARRTSGEARAGDTESRTVIEKTLTVNSGRSISAPGVARPATTVMIKPAGGALALDLLSVWHHGELLYFLIWRDVKVRYKQTFIGAGWAVLQPLLTMVIFTAVFSGIAKIPSDGVPYPIFAYCGPAAVDVLFVRA